MRSKEILREKKALEDTSQTTRIAAETLYNRAVEKAKAWEGIDWVSALKTLDAESFNALKAEADKDYSDLNFYRDGLQSEVQRYHRRQEQEVQARIQGVVAEISHAETGIPGFNEDLGNKLASYALEMGVPQDRLTDLVHTPIMRILHDAWRYRQSETAKSKTKPVMKTPTKIVKQSSNSETSRRAATPTKSSAMERLKRTGSQDDAADAFLAMWKDD